MLANRTVRPLGRIVLLLPVALLYGCADAPNPVAPRLPDAPQAIVADAISVTNTDDAGAGSLRQAIIDAPDGAAIRFDPAIAGQTIVLSTGTLEIDKTLTIEGPLASGMTISGGFSFQVFHIDNAGNAILRNLSIVNGYNKFGGGLSVEGTAILDHSLVANNEAAEAAGGGISVSGSGLLAVVNSTISGNVSPTQGGGIYSIGSTSIRNSTIVNNAAGQTAGGIYAVGESLALRNSIVANNVAAAESNCHVDLFAVTYIGRILSNDASCGADPTIAVGNPALDPLANNGGPTKTHALRIGSPAIDGGSACSENTDQRYVARNQGASCDVGAFEFDAFRVVALTVNPNVAVNAKTGVATVTGTISCDGPAPTPIRVVLSQTQKTAGKFTTIVQATLAIPFTCVSTPTSWSIALVPSSGKFEPGAATGTVSTLTVPLGYVPANVVASLKLFQVK
jgi:hypothetical protein